MKQGRGERENKGCRGKGERGERVKREVDPESRKDKGYREREREGARHWPNLLAN